MTDFLESSGHVIRPAMQVSKRKGRREQKERLRVTIRRFKRSPFPLFGLPPSWSGDRWFARSSWGSGPGRSEEIEALALGHGLLRSESPRLLVQSEAPGLAQGASELQRIAEELWRNGAASIDEAVERYRADSRLPEGGVERPAEAEAEIPVDGFTVRFRVLRRMDSWVANTELPNVWITIESTGFDIEEVEIVTVGNLEPYIRGTHTHLLPPRRHRGPS